MFPIFLFLKRILFKMIEKATAKKILNILLKNGGDFSEIYAQKRISNNLRLEDEKIENSSSGFEIGCGLRLISKESTFYAYVDSLEKDALLNAAKVLSAAVSEKIKGRAIDLNERSSRYKIKIESHPSDIKQQYKKSILDEINTSARNYSHHIIQVTANISDLEEEVFIANSKGFFANDSIIKVFAAVNVVAKKGSEIRTGYKSLAKTKGFEIFNNNKPGDLSAEASRIAVTMLDAIDAPAAIMPAVIGNAFGGVIFHEACGHGLEADAVIKDASVYKNKLGTKIASDIVTAVDDSTLPYHWGSYSYDGEGFPSKKNILIEEGILKGYLFDYKSSVKMGLEQTGNGRRQSYRDIPVPRMSNTYIDKGKGSRKDIIESVKKGVFAKEFAGGQVDPATGDFVFGISEGYMVKNGKICEPIKGATLIGNGPEILKKIEAIGTDLDFAPGFCGKAGQSVSNEVGQPTILISSITVGGTKV